MSPRPVSWRDCWTLYKWRKEYEPSLSFWQHLRWFSRRVNLAHWWRTRFWVVRLDKHWSIDGWIVSFQVPKKFQGMGFGKAAIRWLNRLSYWRLLNLIAHVDSGNTASRKCFLAAGWEEHDKGLFLVYTYPKFYGIIDPWQSSPSAKPKPK